MDEDVPDHRHQPGDDFSGGRKPGHRKARPDGRPFDRPRPEGQGSGGRRFEGPRFQGPRPAGQPGDIDARGGHGPAGPRPDAPRPDGPVPYRGPGGQRSFGPRRGPGGAGGPDAGPRPSGFGYGAPRPGGYRSEPRSGGFRPGGFRPGPPWPDFEPEPERGGGPHAPRREWQPRDDWNDRSSEPRRGSSDSRPSYGQRPGFGPRPSYGQRPGPRPGYGERPGPRPRRAGFGFDGGRPEQTGPRFEADAREPFGAGFETGRPDAADFSPTAENEAALPAEPGFDPRFDRSRRQARSRAPIRPDYRARSGGYPERRSFGQAGGAATPWARTPPGPAPSDLLGEGEELIAGRHPVEEAFIAHRKAIRLLVVPQRRLALEKLVLHATNLRIPIVEVEGGTLTALAGFDGHQGIALVTDRRQLAGLDDILARAIERKEPPFVLVLDSLEDPQNFGSLLRTAEASGVHGVIYPVRRQAPLSPAAVKASAGAVEHLLLVPVEDLAEALTDLHVRGLRVIGSDADAQLTARQADLRGPLVVVVGSEGQGLGPAVRRRCDAVVRIPMRGQIESLNAAVAGSILLYEASSQRGGEKPLVGPEAGTEPVGVAGRESSEGVAVEETAAAEPAAGAPEPATKARGRRAAPKSMGPSEVDPLPAPDDEALLPGTPAAESTGTDSAG